VSATSAYQRGVLTRAFDRREAKAAQRHERAKALVLPSGANPRGPGSPFAAASLVLRLIGYIGFWLFMLFKPVKGNY